MKTSIIISTYNSPQWLQKVIWGFSAQSYGDFEILVADDGSSGENLEVNKHIITSAKITIKHVWQKDHGFRKCRALNKAIIESSGNYLIFTDGDCIPHPRFIETHVTRSKPQHFLSGGYSKLPMALSTAIERDHILSGECFEPTWLLKNGLSSSSSLLKIGARRLGLNSLLNAITPAKRTFNGNNSSCFKEDALLVNGFDERMHYGGEDREFGYRLENNGVKPVGIRYSAPCLHLDHPRGYVDEALRQKNRSIIDETQKTKKRKTCYGLEQLS